jgi:hypothetical protein
MSTTKVLIDTWFCADILFTSYKIIIILFQAKKCNRDSAHLPRRTVDLARKSLKVFQSLMGPTVRSFWGIRYVTYDLAYLGLSAYNHILQYSVTPPIHIFLPFMFGHDRLPRAGKS